MSSSAEDANGGRRPEAAGGADERRATEKTSGGIDRESGGQEPFAGASTLTADEIWDLSTTGTGLQRLLTRMDVDSRIFVAVDDEENDDGAQKTDSFGENSRLSEILDIIAEPNYTDDTYLNFETRPGFREEHWSFQPRRHPATKGQRIESSEQSKDDDADQQRVSDVSDADSDEVVEADDDVENTAPPPPPPPPRTPTIESKTEPKSSVLSALDLLTPAERHRGRSSDRIAVLSPANISRMMTKATAAAATAAAAASGRRPAATAVNQQLPAPMKPLRSWNYATDSRREVSDNNVSAVAGGRSSVANTRSGSRCEDPLSLPGPMAAQVAINALPSWTTMTIKVGRTVKPRAPLGTKNVRIKTERDFEDTDSAFASVSIGKTPNETRTVSGAVVTGTGRLSSSSEFSASSAAADSTSGLAFISPPSTYTSTCENSLLAKQAAYSPFDTDSDYIYDASLTSGPGGGGSGVGGAVGGSNGQQRPSELVDQHSARDDTLDGVEDITPATTAAAISNELQYDLVTQSSIRTATLDQQIMPSLVFGREADPRGQLTYISNVAETEVNEINVRSSEESRVGSGAADAESHMVTDDDDDDDDDDESNGHEDPNDVTPPCDEEDHQEERRKLAEKEEEEDMILAEETAIRRASRMSPEASSKSDTPPCGEDEELAKAADGGDEDHKSEETAQHPCEDACKLLDEDERLNALVSEYKEIADKLHDVQKRRNALRGRVEHLGPLRKALREVSDLPAVEEMTCLVDCVTVAVQEAGKAAAEVLDTMCLSKSGSAPPSRRRSKTADHISDE